MNESLVDCLLSQKLSTHPVYSLHTQNAIRPSSHAGSAVELSVNPWGWLASWHLFMLGEFITVREVKHFEVSMINF